MTNFLKGVKIIKIQQELFFFTSHSKSEGKITVLKWEFLSKLSMINEYYVLKGDYCTKMWILFLNYKHDFTANSNDENLQNAILSQIAWMSAWNFFFTALQK